MDFFLIFRIDGTIPCCGIKHGLKWKMGNISGSFSQPETPLSSGISRISHCQPCLMTPKGRWHHRWHHGQHRVPDLKPVANDWKSKGCNCWAMQLCKDSLCRSLPFPFFFHYFRPFQTSNSTAFSSFPVNSTVRLWRTDSMRSRLFRWQELKPLLTEWLILWLRSQAFSVEKTSVQKDPGFFDVFFVDLWT